MAGPISHIVYAEKALKTFLNSKDEQLFTVGTLFPDICALGVIERDATHFRNVTLNDIQQELDSFKAGVLFHSISDTTREAFVSKHHAYNDLPDSYLSTVALKICEDMQLYSKVKNWRKYIDYLQTIAPQEKEFGIPIERLEKWHAMHRDFLANPVFDENAEFFSSLGFNPEQISELSELVTNIIQSRVIDSYLDDFYSDLEQHLN